jgi:hypothetical protein
MNNNIKEKYFIYLLFSSLYVSLLIGLYLNEDNLGGAAHDSMHHFKISEKFSENFFKTFNEFGNIEQTRNSPIFWIFLSFFSKLFSYKSIQFLNTILIIPLTYFFFKCLKIKYKGVKLLHLAFLSSFLFLSPSLRSLIIWPYSLSWGLFFFVISIYFFLKYENNLNLFNSLKIISSLAIASYIYPSFAVFYLFYIYKIFKNQNIKTFFLVIFLSLVISLPCFYYILSRDVISSFQGSQGFNVSLNQSFNLSNKILIISTICFYILLPIINFKRIFEKILEIKKRKIYLIIIFCFVNFYFFNFPYSVWGGGFFHKVSNFLFGNNILFFLFSIFSILYLFSISDEKFENYLLLIILILYNPQLTIYIKYFDPLVFIIFLTLFNFNLKEHISKKNFRFYQFYGFIFLYYAVIYFKKLYFLDLEF